MQFEWDKNKNKSNTEKHGITFEESAAVFSDENSMYLFDRNIHGEIRQHVIGKINNFILALVVYTDRNGKMMIISARRANKKEKDQYYAK